MKHSLLFGNGLNRVTKNSVSWDRLLDELKNPKFESKELPNTMIYERIYLERNYNQEIKINEEEKIKEQISIQMHRQEPNIIYDEIIKLNFDNYITTNYDTAFEKAVKKDSINRSTEELYSIRRYKQFENYKLWNIHGEIAHPKSIMLGLDHYCGSISKIDTYIKGKYTYTKNKEKQNIKSIKEKLQLNLFDNVSWIELFFNTHIHIMGLGLDYSETDLWWMLNKRRRLMHDTEIKNRIYFYTHEIEDEKKGLLESFGVEVVETKLENNDYIKMYRKIIAIITTKKI